MRCSAARRLPPPRSKKKHKRYSKREIQRIADMWNAGKRSDHIVREMGLSINPESLTILISSWRRQGKGDFNRRRPELVKTAA